MPLKAVCKNNTLVGRLVLVPVVTYPLQTRYRPVTGRYRPLQTVTAVTDAVTDPLQTVTDPLQAVTDRYRPLQPVTDHCSQFHDHVHAR